MDTDSAPPADPSSARISPTAHYTGFVWYRNGMSYPAFRTREGQLLHAALRPMNAVYELAGRPSLDGMLLARHRVIDFLLGQAIEAGDIGQVVEVAAGLSPRGRRFSERYADRGLTYVEADLPGMIARKREVLGRAGVGSDHHHLVDVDALADVGPRSLFESCGPLLDPSRGCALITEGLLGYFDPRSVEGMWNRFARFLGGYAGGMYLADLHTRADAAGVRGARLFQRLLSMFARGQVHLHFDGPEDAERGLVAAGFDEAVVHDPADFAGEVELPGFKRFVVHVLAARVG
jgi:O-methyltransferase involved in polyketide biosynthesis